MSREQMNQEMPRMSSEHLLHDSESDMQVEYALEQAARIVDKVATETIKPLFINAKDILDKALVTNYENIEK
jgi:hypothetical protein